MILVRVMTRETPWKGIGIPSICISRSVRKGKIRILNRINKRRRIRVVRDRISMRRSLRMNSDDEKGR